MADNTTLNTGSGGDTLRTEDRTTFKTPVSLIDVGGTSAESILGDAGVTLPANLRSEQVDDAAFTPATSRVLMVGAEYDDTTPDSVDEGDGGAVRMSARRELYTQIRDAAGNERGVNVNASNQLAIAGPVTNAGTFAVQVDGTALTRLTDIETNTDSNAVVGNGAAATAQRVTLANDSTGIIATVGAVTAITNALPAGTNAIGKLAANSGVDIGDVDVTSIIPGTGATNLGKAEDAAHSSGDVGVAAMTVRQDTAAALAGTDADYQPLITDASGRLHVNVGNTVTVGSHAVTNAGTFAVQDSEKVADDAAFTVATTKVQPVGFLADETATDSVDEGDVGAARMTLDRKQHVVNEFESNSIRASGTAMTPKYAAIAAATSGDNDLIAVVASRKLRVLALAVCPAAAVNLYFTSNAAGTVIFGGSTNKINLAAAGNGFCLPFNPVGWFETASGHKLVMNLSGAVAVSGGVVYCEVP